MSKFAMETVEFNEALVHQVVTAYLANNRKGTKAQKTRSEVRGGGKKPWRQKGTGSARCGTIRSPLWRGGGIIFAAKPRAFTQKINKKMYRIAIKSIFAELMRQNRLVIENNFEVEQPKTKELVNKLNSYGVNDKNSCLIIKDNIEKTLTLAARNIYYITVCDAQKIDPVNLIKHEKVIITSSAMEHINGMLK